MRGKSMERPPKVIIVHPNRNHNYDGVKEFGDACFVFEGRVNVFHMNEMIDHIKSAIKFAEEDDYILLAGNIVANSFFMSIWMRKFNYCRLLVFGAREGNYVEMEVSGDSLELGSLDMPALGGAAL
jgi:hypothetical protein